VVQLAGVVVEGVVVEGAVVEVVSAVGAGPTDEIVPSDTESLPMSRSGPDDVMENPVTRPLMDVPEGSLPVTVCPIRFAAADV